jgi:hypothetical protein
MDEQLDLQLLEYLVPQRRGPQRHRVRELCEALDLDSADTFVTAAEIFHRRRAMASEEMETSMIAEALAMAETFVIGIAYGYQLALARAELTD